MNTARAAGGPPVDVVTTPVRRAQFESSGSWTDDSLPSTVLRYAASSPDKPAVIDLEGARRVTYGELAHDMATVAADLAARGVGVGDVVTVQLPNWYETIAVDLGVISAGAVLNPVLPMYRGNELDTVLEVARSRILYTPHEYRGFDHVEMFEGLGRQGLADLQHVAVADPVHRDKARHTLRDALDSERERALELPASRVSELIFTSGTEAQPKAIMHTEQTTTFAARAAGEALGLTSDDVVWMPSPIGHSTGFNYGVRVALHHGATLVLQDRWDAGVAARLIESLRCTYTVAATTFLADLISHARTHAVDLSSMRLFGSGGAPVPPELVAGAEEFGMCVLRLYGSTEVLVATWNRPDSPADKRVATDGRAIDALEVEVRDDEGAAVFGAPGEIFVRGPSTSVGFFADPERTAATFDEHGWVRSGDLGVLDADGYLTIVGRRKEIIIRGGLNIAPRELEDIIHEHASVARVSVIGLPDERLGELVCACIVPEPGRSLTLDELVAHLEQRGVARFKLPQELVMVDELPMTPTGKVRKYELVAAVAGARDARN